MADRVVKVTLSAQVNQYLAGMAQARKATRDTGTEAEKLAQKRQDFDRLGRAGLAMGAALGLGLTLAVSKAADFNQAMSYVDAATHETADNMGLLRDAAIEAGASTVFSATESANAIEEMGKAGLSTSDILSGGLKGSLDLAAAGGLGVAEAAGSMATALKQFGLEGQDSSHVADLLAAGAGKAMGDVSDLSMALGQTGLVAKSTGLSIEETTGGLSAFASAGLLGSDAGTSFKTMLQRLTPQSAEAREKMKELGISAYDANGQFIGLSKFAGVLQTALKDLTPEQRNAAQAVIFGSDAVRASNVLYEEGAAGIQSWIDKVDDQGYAADTAARRLDNLKGDLEQLGGAFDTALIQGGAQANDALRILTQTATGVVDNFNAMPEPLQAVGLGVGGLAAAATLAGGAFFTLLPKVTEFKELVEDMSPGVQRASRYLAGFAKGLGIAAAVGAAATALEALQDQLDKAAGVGDKLNNTLATTTDTSLLLTNAFKDKTWNQYGADLDMVTEKFAKFVEQTSTAPDTRWMGGLNSVLGLDPSSDRARDQFAELGKQLAQLAASDAPKAEAWLRRLRDEYQLSDSTLSKLIDLMPEYKTALMEQASTAGINAADANTLLKVGLEGVGESSTEAADGLTGVSQVAEMTSDNMAELAAGVRDYGSATTELIGANSDLYQSIDDAKAAWGEEGFEGTLDLTTQAGRDNTDMLLALADAANNAAAETYESSGSQDQLIGKLNEGRQALFDQARQFFDTDEAAWNYVDTLMQTPKDITTQVALNGVNEAKTQAEELLALLDSVATPRQTSVGVKVDNPFYNPNYNQLAEVDAQDHGGSFASGGTVIGPGTSKSDSVYARLSRGEEVIQEPYASMFRAELKQMNIGVRPAYSAGGSSMQFTVNAPPGPSAQAIGRAAYEEANWRMRAGV
jgi:TP901 family phage tail tape measure protein